MNEETVGTTTGVDLNDSARAVCQEVDGFVRTKPYLAALGAFLIGAAVVHSLRKEHRPSRSEALADTLDELKNMLGSVRNEVGDSAGRVSGRVSSAFGNAFRNARRFI